MAQSLRKYRPKNERLPGDHYSAIWSVPGGYDLFVYSRGREHWVVRSGICESELDLRVSDALRGQKFRTRGEALQAAEMALELLAD